MNIHIFPAKKAAPANTIFPKQTHSCNIVEIVSGDEDLKNCDGLWTKKNNSNQFSLGVKTADCAAITFYCDSKYGIIHAGWRGCVNGIIENMNKLFEETNTQISIGPILPKFEIKKDNCYLQIQEKFGKRFFIQKNKKIIFDFKSCLLFMMPSAIFDKRKTFDNSDLASWRRDKHFENGQNKMTIAP